MPVSKKSRVAPRWARQRDNMVAPFRRKQKGTPNKVTAELRGAAQQYTMQALEVLAQIAQHGESESARVSAAQILARHGPAGDLVGQGVRRVLPALPGLAVQAAGCRLSGASIP